MAFATVDDRKAFINYLSNCIWASQFNCLGACPKGYIPQEPDFIAFLVKDLSFYIPIILKHKFNITNCTTQGVFCHQSPKVKFSNPNPLQKDCAELGDLLIVYTENQNSTIQSRALLLQAKCITSTPHNIDLTREGHQLYLYQNWPDFQYSSPQDLIKSIESYKTNHKQNIKPHRQVEAKHKNPVVSDYLLLPKPPSQAINYCYVTSKPNNQLICKHALATNIGKMLNLDSDDDSGSIFELIPDYDPSKDYIPDDDWSNMINDIIYVAKQRYFNRKKIRMIKQRRIFGFMCNENGICSNDDYDTITFPANGDDKRDFDSDDGEFAGISTLMINVNI